MLKENKNKYVYGVVNKYPIKPRTIDKYLFFKNIVLNFKYLIQYIVDLFFIVYGFRFFFIFNMKKLNVSYLPYFIGYGIMVYMGLLLFIKHSLVIKNMYLLLKYGDVLDSTVKKIKYITPKNTNATLNAVDNGIAKGIVEILYNDKTYKRKFEIDEFWAKNIEENSIIEILFYPKIKDDICFLSIKLKD